MHLSSHSNTWSKLPGYLAEHKAGRALALSTYHQAPERLWRTWQMHLLSRTLRALDNALRMAIPLLFGAKRLTTSGCSRQALRQTGLPPDLLLIRSALGHSPTLRSAKRIRKGAALGET